MAANTIDTAVASGANDVNRVSFTLQEATREQAREQAVKKAVQDARNEAENVAQEMDLTLGQPVNIDVSSTGFRPYTPQFDAVAGGKASIPVGKASTPIQPGKVTVTANIDVIYGFNTPQMV